MQDIEPAAACGASEGRNAGLKTDMATNAPVTRLWDPTRCGVYGRPAGRPAESKDEPLVNFPRVADVLDHRVDKIFGDKADAGDRIGARRPGHRFGLLGRPRDGHQLGDQVVRREGVLGDSFAERMEIRRFRRRPARG